MAAAEAFELSGQDIWIFLNITVQARVLGQRYL